MAATTLPPWHQERIDAAFGLFAKIWRADGGWALAICRDHQGRERSLHRTQRPSIEEARAAAREMLRVAASATEVERQVSE